MIYVFVNGERGACLLRGLEEVLNYLMLPKLASNLERIVPLVFRFVFHELFGVSDKDVDYL